MALRMITPLSVSPRPSDERIESVRGEDVRTGKLQKSSFSHFQFLAIGEISVSV